MLARADIIVSIISDDYALGDVTGGASGIFGAPATGTGQMLRWVADWVRSDGRSLGKPTKYESRSGRF